MLTTIQNLCFLGKLEPQQEERIRAQIRETNFLHLRLIVIAVSLYAVYLVFSDFLLIEQLDKRQFTAYFVFDLTLLFVSIIMVVILFLTGIKQNLKVTEWVLILYCTLCCFITSSISSFEFLTSEFSYTYLFSLFILAFVFYLDFWQHAIILLSSLLYFSFSFSIYRIPVSSYSNTLFPSVSIGILSLFLSRILYQSKKRSVLYEYSMEIALKEKAEANQAKTVFLRNISHELRTPLTGILGFAATMGESTDDPDTEKYAELIHGEGEKLLSLINRLLDISKIEVGKLELNSSIFSLQKCINGFISSYSERALLKGLEFHSTINPSVPDYVEGDMERIQQVLANITGNAIKFTTQGSVSIDVSAESQNDNVSVVHFTISDTGVGIAKEKLSAIFDPFIQEDGSVSRHFGGTGLGTTISKQLVEMMGGNIRVESEKNRGSKFSFSIPLRLADVQDQGTGKKGESRFAQLEGLRILMAEDYEVNQKIARHHLEQAGCKVTIVENGKKCLETLGNAYFDLILLDIQMPVMDGLETIREIRNNPSLSHYPVIAITANVFEEDRKQYLSLGMDAIIPKPFRKSEMFRIISDFV